MKLATSFFGFVMASSFACAETSAPNVTVPSPIPVEHVQQSHATETPIGLIIGLSGSRPLGEVARDLAREGFDIDKQLELVEMITGRAAATAIQRLRKVPGVSFVERETTFIAQSDMACVPVTKAAFVGCVLGAPVGIQG